MPLEDRIRLAIRDCTDPTIPLNLVDLGCLESIFITEDREAPGAGIPGIPPRFQIAITLLPASEDEATQAQLRALVHNRLAGLPEISQISISLLSNWTPARISPEGRRRLKLDQPTFPILNNHSRR